MDRGLVSIIMPAYHADRFIPVALDSILRQRYDRWELIVVEDASDGETARYVDQFRSAAGDRHVTYLRHDQNQGPAACRNTAIGAAQGEFLALLDADDIWLDTHLERAVEALANDNADIAYSTAVMFDDETDQLIGLLGPTTEQLRRAPRDLRTFPNWLFHRNLILPSASVMNRRVIDMVGLFNTAAEVRFVEDLEYWLRAARAGTRFAHVPGLNCLYRKAHAQAATGQLATILSRQANVLEKNLDFPGLPKRVTRRQASYFHTAAAVFQVDRDPKTAAQHLFQAWQIRPSRLHLLMLSGWTRWVVPVLPDFGIARAVRRSQGYD